MKKRLDLILFERGFFETKNKAAANILAGNVKINGEYITKAGTLFLEDKIKEIEVKSLPFVSRGGLKLEAALKAFEIDLKDKITIDIGASTGGFTDCMLQRGAKKVYAIDVGHNQLDWKLRQDERVIVREKTNVKNCNKSDIFDDENPDMPEFMCMDLSFISIKKVLENVLKFTSDTCEMVLLIKPQFEAQRDEIQKGGVVKDMDVHNFIIEDIKNYALCLNLTFKGIIDSPILGNKSGNKEYLIYLAKN